MTVRGVRECHPVLLLVLAALLHGCSGTRGDREAVSATIPGGRGRAVIDLTTVPPLGSSDDLQGQAWHVRPATHWVAVYIRVDGHWWTKPTAAQPYTSIRPDGTWTCDITTGGADSTADKIAAFLAPRSYAPPVLLGADSLPGPLYRNSKAWVEYARLPGASFRTFRFSGCEWAVKSSNGPVGPGDNWFSDSGENVWLDQDGKLHLEIENRGGRWYCSEVILRANLGRGKYQFTLDSFVDQLDPNAVLGLFTWDDDPTDNHRETDIELARWSDPQGPNAQYVVQPWNTPGNRCQWTMPHVAPSTHLFDWRADRVLFHSHEGRTASGTIIKRWMYQGSDVPSPGLENPRINLWLNEHRPPEGPVEVVVARFRHGA